jgi:dynein heavy chain
VTHTRAEYWAEMQKFRNLYSEINDNIPFFVRMNMILIDGVDIKRLYLRICNDILRKLQQSILTNIIVVRNDKIQEMIKVITEEIKEKAENTEKLVQI